MEPAAIETVDATKGAALEVVPLSVSTPTPQIDPNLLLLVATIVAGTVQALKRSGALHRVPSRWIPVVSIGLAVAGTSAASIANGNSFAQGVLEGLLAGLSATGIYEVGKPRVTPEAAS